MKYRLLTNEELEPLKEDFIKFLSANTITGEDWKKIKEEKPNEAERIVGIFSDIVWEKSLEKIKFLEHRDHKHLKVFKCSEEHIHMVGFEVKSAEAPSLLAEDTFERIASGKLPFSTLKAEFYQSEKEYDNNRHLAMFNLMEQGCTPCTEAYFYGIKSLIK